MRKAFWPRTLRYFAALWLVALVPGCANKYETLTPDVQATMMSDLKLGKLVLDCGAKCVATWIVQVDSINALDSAERWPDLAQKVMQIGYGQDLAYYYLGQAAQGLGYHDAAIKYYQYSNALATGQDQSLQCEALRSDTHDPCQGVDLASSIPVLIQASRNAMAAESRQSTKRAAAARRNPVTPVKSGSASGGATPASSGTAPPAGWSMPPPPPTSD